MDISLADMIRLAGAGQLTVLLASSLVLQTCSIGMSTLEPSSSRLALAIQNHIPSGFNGGSRTLRPTTHMSNGKATGAPRRGADLLRPGTWECASMPVCQQ